MDTTLPLLAILWLGILTAISPCPLTTNIAAISYISRQFSNKPAMVLSGISYTVGRSISYLILGILIVSAAIDASAFSISFQEYVNKVLGILLVLVGMITLQLLPFSPPTLSFSHRFTSRLAGVAFVGPILLGALFALAFCPVSAALFFGTVIPLAIQHDSRLLLPLVYSIGTAVPVLVMAGLIAGSASSLASVFNKVQQLERYARCLTGVIFILAGLYLIGAYIFGLW